MKENQRKECVFFFFSKFSLQKRRSKKYFGGELEIIEKKRKKEENCDRTRIFACGKGEYLVKKGAKIAREYLQMIKNVL